MSGADYGMEIFDGYTQELKDALKGLRQKKAKIDRAQKRLSGGNLLYKRRATAAKKRRASGSAAKAESGGLGDRTDRAPDLQSFGQEDTDNA